jgi:ribonuclease D
MFWKSHKPLKPITKTADLSSICDKLCACDFIAVDTEFLRDTTYWPKLCLIQVAGGDVEAIIDPLADGLDLTPFYAVLHHASVLKVFHAARQDLEIFYQSNGKVPGPIFDSQIAGSALGLGESISYENLVATLLGKSVDKSSRFTDWAQRPLSEAQLRYALADVTHLRDLFPRMANAISEQKRESWIRETMEQLTAQGTYAAEPDEAWQRLKLRKTSKAYLATLKAAAAWREREAQTRNVPRQRILKDDILYEIAQRQPKDAEALGKLRGLPGGFAKSARAEELMAALAPAYANPDRYAPDIGPRRAPPPPSLANVVGFLKLLLQVSADEHKVAARLVASTSELERFAEAASETDPLCQGWRGDVFGKRALRLVRGEIALKLEGHNVVVTEIA